MLDVVNLRLMGDEHAPSEGPIAEQFTALAELQRRGLIRHLGLSNATAAQVEQARQWFACRTISTSRTAKTTR